MPEYTFGDEGKTLEEIAEEAKDEKGQIKKIVPLSIAAEEVREYAKKKREAIKKRNQEEYERLETKTMKIPDFNDFLQFCDKYRENDYEIEQFHKHTIPREMYRKVYKKPRGGGGWSGAVKATINILRKMKEKGVL